MPQIRDIARLAGVHRSTVSRVLSGKGYASAESREKVMKVVRKLDYHVNPIARALKSKQKNALGFFTFWHYDINPAEPWYQQTLLGILASLTRSKSNLVLNNIRGLLSEENRELGFFYDSQLGGALMMAPRVKEKDLSFLRKVQIPVVLLYYQIDNPQYSWIDLDNVAGARMAVEHLIGLGHRRVGFIGGDREFVSNARDRYIGYQKALQAAGIAERAELALHGYFSFEFGKEGARKLLGLPESKRPTALFCATDSTALGAMEAAGELGLKIPKQVSIVGFDDNIFAATANPPLTTIRQPFTDIGRQGVETLEAIIKDPKRKPRQVLIKPELILRKSTAPL